jgi:aarF domain-containing kinase
MNQLYDIMYEFNFSLPPDYALVIRALGSLEGTAKVLDPDFKVIESAYPFVIGRLIADPSPDMRRILRELVIRNNGSIRWNRLERLVRYKFFYHASHVIITWNVDSNIFCKLINLKLKFIQLK